MLFKRVLRTLLYLLYSWDIYFKYSSAPLFLVERFCPGVRAFCKMFFNWREKILKWCCGFLLLKLAPGKGLCLGVSEDDIVHLCCCFFPSSTYYMSPFFFLVCGALSCNCCCFILLQKNCDYPKLSLTKSVFICHCQLLNYLLIKQISIKKDQISSQFTDSKQEHTW